MKLEARTFDHILLTSGPEVFSILSLMVKTFSPNTITLSKALPIEGSVMKEQNVSGEETRFHQSIPELNGLDPQFLYGAGYNEKLRARL